MSILIPYGQQEITQQDIDAVLDVLHSEYLTQGPVVPQFENSISKYCGAKYSTAVNSATSALHLSCLALGVSQGDCVWTSPISFVASANCAVYCGASVDFVDIDSQTYNISVQALTQKLIQAEQAGGLPKVVIPVHLAGQSCDMAAIHELAQKYGFKIIEDASHAIGGKYRDQAIGNCRYSDITVFSFHPVKIITTAEGGVATTNQSDIATKIKLLRSHGITRDIAQMEKEPSGDWYYEQIELGYNYRMTEIQAALGLSQMDRLDEYVKRRHMIADKYNKEFDNIPVTIPLQSDENYSSFHLYPIRLHLNDIKLSHANVFRKLRENGIGVNLHYIPIHTQPYFQKLAGSRLYILPQAEAYYKEAISIPLYSHLTNEDQDKVVAVLKEVVNSA